MYHSRIIVSVENKCQFFLFCFVLFLDCDLAEHLCDGV